MRLLQSLGISPDFVGCRGEGAGAPLKEGVEKISLQCNVKASHVIQLPHVESVYALPQVLAAQHVGEKIMKLWHLKPPHPLKGSPSLRSWARLAHIVHNPPRGFVRIAFVGKYLAPSGTQEHRRKGGEEMYQSAVKALEHAALRIRRGVEFVWIAAEDLDPRGNFKDKERQRLQGCDGIFIPGGFGLRGFEGLVEAVRVARRTKNSLFGGCCLAACSKWPSLEIARIRLLKWKEAYNEEAG